MWFQSGATGGMCDDFSLAARSLFSTLEFDFSTNWTSFCVFSKIKSGLMALFGVEICEFF